jgi:hypothetical protein
MALKLTPARERQERLLDDALAATFPASDPIAPASTGRAAARNDRQDRIRSSNRAPFRG